MKMPVRTLFVVVGLVLASCGVAGNGTGAGETTSVPPTGPSSTSTIGTTAPAEDPMEHKGVVETAIRDLAGRLDVSEADIEVIEVKDVQWPDGALGCPEEGKMYTQALVDGSQVLLGVDERIYDYHAGSDGEPFLCPSDEKDGGYDFLPPPGGP